MPCSSKLSSSCSSDWTEANNDSTEQAIPGSPKHQTVYLAFADLALPYRLRSTASLTPRSLVKGSSASSSILLSRSALSLLLPLLSLLTTLIWTD